MFRCVAFLLLLTSAGSALGHDDVWYGRLAYLNSEFDFSGVAGFGFSSDFLQSVDDTDQGGELLLGYRLLDWFALEAAYSDLGQIEASQGLACPVEVLCLTAASADFAIESSAISLQGRFTYAISSNWDVFATVGVSHLDTEITTTLSDFTVVFPNLPIDNLNSIIRNDRSETEARFGIGTAWHWSDAWGLDLRAERIGDDIDVASIGLLLNF